MSSLILYYDGQLNVTEDFTPTYSGGRNRPILVSSIVTLEELKLQVIHALRRDSATVTVNLVARIRANGGYTATSIDDDEVCTFILTQSRRKNMIVYVEFVELSQENLSMSPNFEYPNEEHHISQSNIGFDCAEPLHNYQMGEPSHRTNEISECRTLIEEHSTYESMGSDSSDDSSSDEDSGAMLNIPVDTNASIPGHEHVRDHAFNNISNIEDMIMNNEYVQAIQTAEEWDATDAFDEPASGNAASLETLLPDQVVEGLTFATKEALQFAVIGWSVTNNVEFKKICSNNSRFSICCFKHDDPIRPCMWRLHAAKSKRLCDNWRISVCPHSHTCVRPVTSKGHRNCNSRFICYFITAILRQQIDLKPREIIGRIESKYHIKVSYSKAWNARQKAIISVFGTYEESYSSMFRLMEIILIAIPGSVYNIQHDDSRNFRAIFWAFGPSIEGWKYCRPVLSLDGTFLLGKYRGTLLAAVGFDGNGGLYPLAFAVVDSESNETWHWFLQKLYHLVYPVRSRRDLCFISDKHFGIVNGCRDIFPAAAHRNCLRHLRENFKKAVRRMAIVDCDTICNKMYTAGNTDDLEVFHRNMHDIKNIKQEAYDWLCACDFSKWTLTHDDGCRYGVMTTNASECFNGVLRRARGLPLNGLIIAIYYNVVALFMKRTNNVNNWIDSHTSTIVPRINTIMMRYEDAARRCPEATCINNEEFQVFDMSCRSYRVDILSANSVACSCKTPQTYHYPCIHAIAAAGCRRWDYTNFVSVYYTLSSYKATYAAQFHTIPDKSHWPSYNASKGVVPLLPPPYKRGAGRPKKRRIKNTMDEERSQSGKKCGLCKRVGHNRSTCPNNPALSRCERSHR